MEDYNLNRSFLSLEEKSVVKHFDASHSIDNRGRFIVPLPRKAGVVPLGESRKQAIDRFFRLERLLWKRGTFEESSEVVREYFKMNHTEPVPVEDLDRGYEEVYYFPMQAVRKETSSTSKIRVVFDASARTSSGTSLNDHLLAGPTVHSLLIDVLLRFKRYKVALTTDVSRMYLAVLLSKSNEIFTVSYGGKTQISYSKIIV